MASKESFICLWASKTQTPDPGVREITQWFTVQTLHASGPNLIPNTTWSLKYHKEWLPNTKYRVASENCCAVSPQNKSTQTHSRLSPAIHQLFFMQHDSAFYRREMKTKSRESEQKDYWFFILLYHPRVSKYIHLVTTLEGTGRKGPTMNMTHFEKISQVSTILCSWINELSTILFLWVLAKQDFFK